MSQTVVSEQFIEASPELVYQAFTRAILLHEWLCDFASVAPRPGGRMYPWMRRLSDLPQEFLARKSSSLNIGNMMANGMLPHTRAHIEQFKNAIADARK